MAKAACAKTCAYGYGATTYPALVAGGLYTIAASGFPGVSTTPHISFTFQVNGFGLAVDSEGNIIEGGSGLVVFLNEQTTTVVRYGKHLPAHAATAIAGTTKGTATCGSGAVNVPATGHASGNSSPNLQWPHPFIDSAGNVYVNDDRVVASKGCTWVLPAATGSLDGMTVTAGRLYSLTGAATTTAATNGAVADTTSFPNTVAAATDAAGNVVVALSGTTPAVRVIAESTGTYYDQAMTDGRVYTICGGGSTTTTPTTCTKFKLPGAARPTTPPAYGLTSLIPGAIGDLLVTDGSSATTGSLYEVTKGPTHATPTVTKVTPSQGPLAGHTKVTITGSGFTTVTSVKFGGKTVISITSRSSTKLTVKDPTSSTPGPVTVSVTAAGGTGTKPTAFTYVEGPTISSVTPAKGLTTGNTLVTITGTNLVSTTLAVDFGGTPGTTAHITTGSTKLTVKTPAHAVGKVAVKVVDSAGTATKATGFQFIPGAPTISSVTPASGSTAGNTTVTVTGTNLVATTLAVDFGGTPGTTAHITTGSTKLTVKTPAHAAGKVAVKVVDSGGTASKATGFKFVPGTPTISNITPARGSTTGNTLVTITGTNLVATTLAVDFGGTPGTTAHITTGTTKLTVLTPAHAVGKVTVKVTDSGGTVSKATGFQFSSGLPTISTITPASGPTTGSTTVTITGTHLVATTLVVDFGGTPGTTAHITTGSTKLTVLTPAHAAGKVTVKVIDSGGTASKATGFQFIPGAPTISSVTPAKGLTTGNTTVTITGTNLVATTLAVDFGGTPGTTAHITTGSTKLSVKTPAHAVGKVTVKVIDSGGTASKATGFKFVPGAPTISSVTPAKGLTTGNTTVTISGTNLVATTLVVDFGGTPGTTAHITTGSTKLTVKTPAHAAGKVTVKVVDSGGTASKATGFQFVPGAPTISSVTPSKGLTTGNTTVTITGTNLVATTLAVDFGGTPGTTAHVTTGTTKLTVKTPAHAAGKVTVKVIDSGGTASKATGFTFVPGTPTITKVTPAKGLTTGDISVTITGTNLVATTLAVDFGGTPGTTAHVTTGTTKLTVKTPAHALGKVTVKVTDSGGQVSKATGFQFVPGAPTVSSVTPISGPTAGNTTVTITGTNLVATTLAVDFGGTPGTTAHITTGSTKLTVKTPAHAGGTVAVKVIDSGGTATKATGFRFIAGTPTITKLTPDKGPLAGGTTVTITGTNFTTVTSVTFGTKTVSVDHLESARPSLTVADPPARPAGGDRAVSQPSQARRPKPQPSPTWPRPDLPRSPRAPDRRPAGQRSRSQAPTSQQ